MSQTAEKLSQKIQTLSDEQLAEVETFIAQLQQDDTERAHSAAFAGLSNPSLRQVWDNSDDDIYNDL